MALLKIARMGHPVLRQRAAAVDEETVRSEGFQRLIDNMVESMRDASGVGLAAPQVHEAVRLVAAEVRAQNPRYPDEGEIPLTVLVNPEILSSSEEIEHGWEGCLSIPDLRGVVPRAAGIRVQALDRTGQPVVLEAEGFLARILQHEIDHLDGILFLDRMSDLRTLTFLKEFERFWQPASVE